MRFYFFLIFSRDSLLLSWSLNAIAIMVVWPMISLIVKQYGQLLLPMKTSCLQFQSYINLYLLTLEMRLKRSSNVKHSVCIVYKMLFNAIEIELSIAHHFFFLRHFFCLVDILPISILFIICDIFDIRRILTSFAHQRRNSHKKRLWKVDGNWFDTMGSNSPFKRIRYTNGMWLWFILVYYKQ